MDIKSAKYVKSDITNENGSILLTLNNDGDRPPRSVPLVVGNRHYDAVMKWAQIEGNTIEAADD
jgi:hypothetical protein|tara:strand:- start:159 stop:350 length:192 start_codon:yes stop_codon:yes gene_type:complete